MVLPWLPACLGISYAIAQHFTLGPFGRPPKDGAWQWGLRHWYFAACAPGPLRTLVMPLSDETQMACCDFVSFMPVITACSNLASVLVYSYLCTLIANILSSFTALITLVVFSCQ